MKKSRGMALPLGVTTTKNYWNFSVAVPKVKRADCYYIGQVKCAHVSAMTWRLYWESTCDYLDGTGWNRIMSIIMRLMEKSKSIHMSEG